MGQSQATEAQHAHLFRNLQSLLIELQMEIFSNPIKLKIEHLFSVLLPNNNNLPLLNPSMPIITLLRTLCALSHLTLKMMQALLFFAVYR